MNNYDAIIKACETVREIDSIKSDDRQLAIPFDPSLITDLKSIDWLYENFLTRGTVSCLIAKSGVGKSLYATTVAVEIATAKKVISSGLARANVWLVNLEDTKEEVYRRIFACLNKNEIDSPATLNHLFINAGAGFNFQIVTSGSKTKLTIDRRFIDQITTKIEELEIGLLIIDPFVNIHHVDENDNMAIDKVVKELSKLALNTNCAILLVHHANKNGSREVGVESSRGASSFIAACRIVRIINQESDGLISISQVKSNYSIAVSDKKFLKIEKYTVGIANSTCFEAGVLGLSDGSNATFELSACDKELAINTIEAAESNKKNRFDSQANDWIGYEIGSALKLKTESRNDRHNLKKIIDLLIQTKEIEKYQIKESNGKSKSYVRAIL